MSNIIDLENLTNDLRVFFITTRRERIPVHAEDIRTALSNLASRGVPLAGSPAYSSLSKIFSKELRVRVLSAWESIKIFFEKNHVAFAKKDQIEVTNILQRLIRDEFDALMEPINVRSIPSKDIENIKKNIINATAIEGSSLSSKIEREVNFFISSIPITKGNTKTNNTSEDYINSSRLDELKNTENSHFDLSRLIRLCEEINYAHQNNCFMTIAMLLRAIIDHVPPIFSLNKFSEVVNNYSGSKSFKELMASFEKSSRKIADSHLHTHIRSKESLPTFTQVNFSPQLDCLLSEIIRILN